MSRPEPSSDQPAFEPEQARGLVDPRVIHPSPEGIFTDDGESGVIDPPPKPSGEGIQPGEDVRGIVDPRSEAAGPDI